MTTKDAAQQLIDAVRSGARSLEYIEESLMIAEAKIAQGEPMRPFTCAEMAEVVALAKAALFPTPTVIRTQAEWEAYRATLPGAEVVAMDAEDAAAVGVVAEATLHSTQPAALLDAMVSTRLVTLTLAHPASSYGQHVAVDAQGQVLDYARIVGLHLLELGTLAAYQQRSSAEGHSGPLGQGVATATWEHHATTLAPFGIRVTRIASD